MKLLVPFRVANTFPPDLAAGYKADPAKQKLRATRIEVTKIQVKDIVASEFAILAQFLKPAPTPTSAPVVGASPAAKPVA